MAGIRTRRIILAGAVFLTAFSLSGCSGSEADKRELSVDESSQAAGAQTISITEIQSAEGATMANKASSDTVNHGNSEQVSESKSSNVVDVATANAVAEKETAEKELAKIKKEKADEEERKKKEADDAAKKAQAVKAAQDAAAADAKTTRQKIVDAITPQLTILTKKNLESANALQDEMNILRQKIADTQNLTVSMAVIEGKTSQLQAQLTLLKSSFDALIATNKRIAEIGYSLQDYVKSGKDLSSSDRVFLSQMGISL